MSSARQFKKELSAQDARLNRHRNTVELRKSKTQEKLKKLRNIADVTPVLSSPMPDLSRIPALKMSIMMQDEMAQETATREFRRLLSIERGPPIQEVIDAGVVPRLVEFLQRWHQPTLQFEAAWALTNIASGTAEHTAIVVDHNATPIFIQLLQSTNDDVREQAVWALGNIAGDSPKLRDLVLGQQALEPLLRQLDPATSRTSMLRNATWTLSNFCRGKPQPNFRLVAPALPTLAALIYSPDEEVLTDACWALSYLSDGTNDRIQAVIDAGVARRLVELLLHTNPQVQTPALRTVGNIVTGDDTQTQLIINCGALPCLLTLLESPRKGIKKEACWTLSNITAGNQQQIQSVMDINLIPPLIHMLANEDFDIKKECAWAISNATSGGDGMQIHALVSWGCIPPLVALLDKPEPRIVTVALEGIENILKWGQKGLDVDGNNPYARVVEMAGGVERIEDLQKHDNHKIYQMAIRILEQYFGADDDVDEMHQPEQNGATYSFQAPQQHQPIHFGGAM